MPQAEPEVLQRGQRLQIGPVDVGAVNDERNAGVDLCRDLLEIGLR